MAKIMTAGCIHRVGVCRALRGLQAAHVQHEAGVQEHQPPLVVGEDGNKDVTQQCQLHDAPAFVV